MLRGSVAVLAVLSIPAPPTGALTIGEAFAIAARSNPTVRAAREAARARHEGVPRAFSAWLPTLHAESAASVTRIGRFPTFTADPTDPIARTSHFSDQQSLGLRYNHNLFHSGRDAALLRQAEEQVLRSHALVEATEQHVLVNVAAVYLDVVRAARTVELREASLAAFDARSRETQAQFDVGDRTQADIAQADAERRVAAADVVAARAELDVQRALFERLVGVVPDNLQAADEPAGWPDTLTAARRLARDAHPTVRAAEHTLRAAEHVVRAAAGNLGPRVDVQGTLTRTVGHGRTLPNSTDMSVGIELTVPLYQGGSVGAQLREAQHVRTQRRDELRAARRAVAERVTGAWHKLHAARQRYTALTAATEASRVALAAVRREAELGERTTREVLDAERNLVSRRVRALSAQRDTVVGGYELLEAIGALTVREIGVDTTPNLTHEARKTRWNLTPGILSLGRE